MSALMLIPFALAAVGVATGRWLWFAGAVIAWLCISRRQSIRRRNAGAAAAAIGGAMASAAQEPAAFTSFAPYFAIDGSPYSTNQVGCGGGCGLGS